MTPRTDDGIEFSIKRVVTSVTRFHNKTDLNTLLAKLRALHITGTLSIHLGAGGLNVIELQEITSVGHDPGPADIHIR